jgi:hypothetical protein
MSDRIVGMQTEILTWNFLSMIRYAKHLAEVFRPMLVNSVPRSLKNVCAIGSPVIVLDTS